ncbi:MAG: uncharacterized protein QOG56_2798 [Solirubrobacteraceae bacterium]|nr:uncharacterized protein [Solirubrobacteraceae bacterium]
MFSATVATMDQRAAFIDLLLGGRDSLPDQMYRHVPGEIVMVRDNRVVRRGRARPVAPVAEAVGLDLGALAAAFADRLQDAGMAVTAEQSERCIGALQDRTPPSRRSLYYLTRETFVTESVQLSTFNRVFADVFGAPAGADRYREQTPEPVAAAA